MLKNKYPYYLANKPQQPNSDLEVTDKFTGEVATRVAMADAKAIDLAIAKAVEAVEPMRKMPAYSRQNVLNYCADRFKEREQELAYSLCVEAGKPIKDSRAEVGRLIDSRDLITLSLKPCLNHFNVIVCVSNEIYATHVLMKE
mgnify:CR=1 FL=1